MQVENRGYVLDHLAIVTGDHLLTALAQVCFYDQQTIAWLHHWCEDMIQAHPVRDADEESARMRDVLVAFNRFVCSYIEQHEDL